MKKFYVSSVSESYGYDCNCHEEEFESFKDCLINVIDEYHGLDDDFNKDDHSEEELEEWLDTIHSENCGEWIIVSIIEEGKGIVYIG